MNSNFLFTSKRLGFRNWDESDTSQLIKINGDPEVMAFFPEIQDAKQSKNFISRMQKHFLEKGYCYFAVELLKNKEFIGFIGISDQNYKAEHTPCVDIGWRLARSHWNNGYASEGALRCLEIAFNEIGLTKIKALCPEINLASEKVMQKLGMKKIRNFKHPHLKGYAELENCVLYEISKSNFNLPEKKLPATL